MEIIWNQSSKMAKLSGGPSAVGSIGYKQDIKNPRLWGGVREDYRFLFLQETSSETPSASLGQLSFYK